MKQFGCFVLILLVAGCATNKPRDLPSDEKAKIHVEMALSSIQGGDTASAFTDLQIAEGLDSDYPRLHLVKGLAYYAKHDMGNSLASMRRAYELDPKDAGIKNAYGKVLYDTRHYRQAEAVLLSASKDYTYTEAYKSKSTLGQLYFDQKNYAKAGEFLNAAIVDNPVGACDAYFYRGRLKAMNGNYNAAIMDYKKATQVFCGGNQQPHLEIANVYMQTKQYDLARKKLLEIINLFPETQVAETANQKLRYLP
ncbi:MAG: tetratricopeptide repeat protein [Bacteriovoracia bacterium]